MQVASIIPPTTPALPHLRHLQLAKMGLQEFPASLACTLRRLTHLDLSCNSFHRLPAAVSKITALEELEICQNHSLELHRSDVEILAALSHLRGLGMKKWYEPGFEYGYPQSGVEVLEAIEARLPHIDIHLFHCKGC